MIQSSYCQVVTRKDKIFLLAPNDDKLKKTISIILRKENHAVSLINDVSEILPHTQHYQGKEDMLYLLLYILPINDQKSVKTLATLQKSIPNLHIIIIYDYLDDVKIQKIKHGLKCTLLERSFDAGVLIETISAPLKGRQEQLV